MRPIALIALLTLTACASPQEMCIYSASKEVRVMSDLISTTQGNINRGYAIGTEKYFEDEQQVCGQIDGEDVFCTIPVAYSRDVPVAVDLDAEQAKLNSLIKKRRQLQQRANAVIAECKIRHPEV